MIQQQTRAQHILERVHSLEEADFTPYILFPAMSLTGVAANTATQVWQTKQLLKQKVQHGGLGAEYAKAKERLSSLRRQRYLTPHMPKTHRDLKRKIDAQKRLIHNIESQALQKFLPAQSRPLLLPGESSSSSLPGSSLGISGAMVR